jgi:RimJ/RimL family protein N-acetyltransferase
VTSINLRPWTEADVERRQEIGLHVEIQRMYGVAGQTRPMTYREASAWASDDRQRWMIDFGDELIGEVTLRMLDAVSRRGRVGVGLFAPVWLGRGFGTEALRRVLDDLFDDRGGQAALHRADLRVLSSNVRAQASYTKLGFVVEGVERETCWLDGRWHDDWMMAVLEQDWRGRATSQGFLCWPG